MPSIPLRSEATYHSRKLISSAEDDFCSLPKDRSEQQIDFDAYIQQSSAFCLIQITVEGLATLKVSQINNKSLLSTYFVSGIVLGFYFSSC